MAIAPIHASDTQKVDDCIDQFEHTALWEYCFLTEVCDTSYQILLMESQLLNRNIITNTLRHYHNAHTCASFAHNPVVREIGQNGEIFTI